jgi:hypothetical protein
MGNMGSSAKPGKKVRPNRPKALFLAHLGVSHVTHKPNPVRVAFSVIRAGFFQSSSLIGMHNVISPVYSICPNRQLHPPALSPLRESCSRPPCPPFACCPRSSPITRRLTPQTAVHRRTQCPSLVSAVMPRPSLLCGGGSRASEPGENRAAAGVAPTPYLPASLRSSDETTFTSVFCPARSETFWNSTQQ